MEKFSQINSAEQAAEKRELLEGGGLQSVHNCFVMNAALAAEGAVFAPYSTFSAISKALDAPHMGT